MIGYFLESQNSALGESQFAYVGSHHSADRRLTSDLSSQYRFAVSADRVAEADGVIVALQGKPSVAGKKAGMDVSPEILNGYLAVGADVVRQISGAFSLAIIDNRARKVILAIDRMGINSLSYSEFQNGFVFSDSARTLSGFPGIRPSIRSLALFEYIFMHMVPAPRTVFDNIFKLEPATEVSWIPGGITSSRYWKTDFSGNATVPFDQLKSELHAALEFGVKQSNPDSQTGAFLSGGLDSSTVAGKLAAFLDTPAKTFSIGFGLPQYDELHFARISNNHFGCVAHEYNVEANDIVTEFSNIVGAFDEPFGNSSAIPTYYCAKLAKANGVNHLLAGDGGDELFGGNERYVRQTIFDYYQRIPRPIRKSLIEPLTQAVSADSQVWPLRKLRSYVEQARIPLPDRFESWNLVFREGVFDLLHPDFADSIDIDGPLNILRDTWASIEQDELLNKMLVYDWKFTLADNDLRKVNDMCKLAGVDVSYPMLHDEVVRVSLKTPARTKMKRLQLRSFYKSCMAGFLPAEILGKEKHGFGLPFGTWLKTNNALRDMIYSNLESLRRRNIMSPSFLTRIIDEHQSGHPNYYGYVIWDLAVLDEWLSQNLG